MTGQREPTLGRRGLTGAIVVLSVAFLLLLFAQPFL